MRHVGKDAERGGRQQCLDQATAAVENSEETSLFVALGQQLDALDQRRPEGQRGAIADPPSEADAELLAKAAPLIQERLPLLGDAPGLLGFLFTNDIAYEDDALATLPGGLEGL